MPVVPVVPLPMVGPLPAPAVVVPAPVPVPVPVPLPPPQSVVLLPPPVVPLPMQVPVRVPVRVAVLVAPWVAAPWVPVAVAVVLAEVLAGVPQPVCCRWGRWRRRSNGRNGAGSACHTVCVHGVLRWIIAMRCGAGGQRICMHRGGCGAVRCRCPRATVCVCVCEIVAAHCQWHCTCNAHRIVSIQVENHYVLFKSSVLT